MSAFPESGHWEGGVSCPLLTKGDMEGPSHIG